MASDDTLVYTSLSYSRLCIAPSSIWFLVFYGYSSPNISSLPTIFSTLFTTGLWWCILVCCLPLFWFCPLPSGLALDTQNLFSCSNDPDIIESLTFAIIALSAFCITGLLINTIVVLILIRCHVRRYLWEWVFFDELYRDKILAKVPCRKGKSSEEGAEETGTTSAATYPNESATELISATKLRDIMIDMINGHCLVWKLRTHENFSTAK